MANNLVTGVVGSDGASPLYDEEARWTTWSIDEIWTGGAGKRKFVPKVNDHVVDPSTFTTWRVTSIDPVTLIPKLELTRPAGMSFEFTETDVLFGVGPGTQADTFRVYVDKSVMPHVMTVDARLSVGGNMCSYAILYLGANIGNTGKALSRMYDASNNFIGNKVPMELKTMSSQFVNYCSKIVPSCYCVEDLKDGEIITAVFYSDDGHVLSKRQLMVENTAFIRFVNHSTRYITGISLRTPFMSAMSNKDIELPLNTPVNSLGLRGVVHYSDGSELELPVDGTKFRIYGLDQYVSTIIGQRMDLVLSYLVSEDEVAYGALTVDNKHITERFTLMTVEPNNAYTVKLFGYPVWISDIVGYRMTWYLYNLDRNQCIDVTEHVRFAANTGAYDPKGWGYLQRRAVTLNLRDVSPVFKPYVHTQVVDIVLKTPPNGSLTPWLVSHESLGERPAYGDGLHAFKKLPSRSQFTISSTIDTYDEWLNRVYYTTYPLIDRYFELKPPKPTHFTLIYNNKEVTYRIDQWNIVMDFGVELLTHSTIFIKFIRRLPEVDLQLSMAAMLVVAI